MSFYHCHRVFLSPDRILSDSDTSEIFRFPHEQHDSFNDPPLNAFTKVESSRERTSNYEMLPGISRSSGRLLTETDQQTQHLRLHPDGGRGYLGEKRHGLLVISESSHGSSNVKELMTRDYWVASRGSQGLICIPHFSIHEVTTLDDRVELKENHCSSAYSRRSSTRLKAHHGYRVNCTSNRMTNVSSIFP